MRPRGISGGLPEGASPRRTRSSRAAAAATRAANESSAGEHEIRPPASTPVVQSG